MGNITKIIDTVTNNTINYTYDNIGRLTREDNLKLGKTKMWTYDEYGNISSSKEGTYTLSTLTSATTYSYGYNSNSFPPTSKVFPGTCSNEHSGSGKRIPKPYCRCSVIDQKTPRSDAA